MSLPSIVLTVHKDTTFQAILHLFNEDDSPFDLTGYSAAVKAQDVLGSDILGVGVILDFNAVVTDEPGGEITLNLSTVETTAIGSENTLRINQNAWPDVDVTIDDQTGSPSTVSKIAVGKLEIKETISV